MTEENPMKKIRLEKVTVNMGVGQSGDELKKAETIMERVTGMKPVETMSKTKNPTWDLREGIPIGAKVTLRGKKASEFLRNALGAKDKRIGAKSFDAHGGFGFGIREYIDLPGAKYDPKIGVRGMDVLVALERRGYRVKRRKICRNKIKKSHLVSKAEAIEFAKSELGIEVE